MAELETTYGRQVNRIVELAAKLGSSNARELIVRLDEILITVAEDAKRAERVKGRPLPTAIVDYASIEKALLAEMPAKGDSGHRLAVKELIEGLVRQINVERYKALENLERTRGADGYYAFMPMTNHMDWGMVDEELTKLLSDERHLGLRDKLRSLLRRIADGDFLLPYTNDKMGV